MACVACVPPRCACGCIHLAFTCPVGLDDAAHVIDGRVDDLVAEGLDQAAAHLVRARVREGEGEEGEGEGEGEDEGEEG